MIERQTIDGREASVMYLTGDLEPAEKADADLIKIVWDDGETAWLSPPGEDEEEDELEENE